MTVFTAISLEGQTADTLVVLNGPGHSLRDQIEGDTLASGARRNPDRLYLLPRGECYTLPGPLSVKPATHIRIEGEPAPPSGADPGMATVMQAAGFSGDALLACSGNVTVKHLWLIFADSAGRQNWSSVTFERDSLNGLFEDCVFDRSRAPVVYVTGRHFRGAFSNCLFRNNLDPAQWWLGRQIAFRSGASADSISTVNCTLENMGMGYESDFVPASRVWYNHNTFLNIAKFPFKEVSWTWLVCTNNVFVNCNFAGERQIDRLGVDPDPSIWGAVLNVDSLPPGGVNGVQEDARVVVFVNNSNYREPMFQDFYASYNTTTLLPSDTIVPEPLINERTASMFASHPLLKLAQIHDGADPRFSIPATSSDSILAFLQAQYASSGREVFWGFHSDLTTRWPLREDLSYANDTLLTAGMGGFPLGDMYHWFPERYAAWEAQAETEAEAIIGLTEVRPSRAAIPAEASLEQNWPNPFNPATQIRYQLPDGSPVSLKVYDLLGREVATLVHGYQQPGNHNVTFQASGFASGVYFYRLAAGGKTWTKKMILLK